MQTTSDEEKGLSAANAQTPMQTGADATASPQRQQPQTLTPRQTRILLALLVGDRTREEIDRTAGASNSPDEVFRLRRDFGLSIPCQRKGSKDRDGHPVQVGVYRLTDADRTAARHLLGGRGVTTDTDHPDAWAPGLQIQFKALSRRTVRRAKDAADVLRVVACHLLRLDNADHRHRSPIDLQRTPMNTVLLGPSYPEAVVLAGLDEFERVGAELPRRADGVLGFEAVIQAPEGADDVRFWGCVVRWLHDTYPVPLLAVVHRDQRTPHLHAVILALLDGKPAGREMQRGAFGFPALRRSFYNRVREDVGLRADRPRRTLAELAASPGRGPRSRAEAVRRDLEELRRTVPAGEWVGSMSIPTPEATPEKPNVQNCAGFRPLPDPAENIVYLPPIRARRPAPKTADFWRHRQPPAVLTPTLPGWC